MLRDPSTRIPSVPRHRPAHRQWPSRQIAPRPSWCSTDLRDGNQALFERMEPADQRSACSRCWSTWDQGIEVGFTSASEIDFDTVRALIEQRLVRMTSR